jgi:hypothetical protein
MAHPTIESFIEDIHIHRLGHGMISPVPGFIFSQAKKKLQLALIIGFFFAHSDLAVFFLKKHFIKVLTL